VAKGGQWPETTSVVFVVDDLAAWLVGLLADAGRKKLTGFMFGDEQERALRPAASAAVQQTLNDLSPAGDEQAMRVAVAVRKALNRKAPKKSELAAPLTGQGTLLEALYASIAAQLAEMDDPDLTGIVPPAAVLGVSGAVLADRLTSYLVREITFRGSHGGLLAPLADQLNHDLTHLQGQRVESKLDQLLEGVEDALARPGSDAAAAGRALSEMTDPFALEVHRPVQPEDPPREMPALPTYVPREHDTELGSMVRAAADGSSGIAVLVGGSSTGKTRACWEALQLLRDRPEPWRLWHPIDPSRPDAVLHELVAVGPRTVVWLNEAQFYLDVPGNSLGEQVAAGLRELLRDPARRPVLVLATLWPSFWDELTARPDKGADGHAQARELLGGYDISVPAAFTTSQLQRLAELGDARLDAAAAGAQDGQVIQFLAGAPELLARYRNASPGARALLHAAVDARRMEMRPALPWAFLKAAASGYLTDSEWDQLPEDWLEQALAYAAVPGKGVGGPLTRIRPRPARRDAGSADLSAVPDREAKYRLADFLDQAGRSDRRGQIPPASFWAAAKWADPGDFAALGQAAQLCGLYRDTAQLYKNAIAHGDPYPASDLLYVLENLHPADRRPANWVVTHVAVHDPTPVSWLFPPLRRVGTEEDMNTLADRAAKDASLNDPEAVAQLLKELQEIGASQQVAKLLDRDPAAQVAIDDVYDVIELLDALIKAGSQPQAHVLVHRAITCLALDEPRPVARLLDNLHRRNAQKHAENLLSRDPAAHAVLDNMHDVAQLLRTLKNLSAEDQVATLASRAAAAVSLYNTRDLAVLVSALRTVDAAQQLTALIDRDPAAYADLDDPWDVSSLLGALRGASAAQQVAKLLDRDIATHVTFRSTGLLGATRGAANLLGTLREAAADEQVTVLAERAAAAVPLRNPIDVHVLLEELKKTRQAAKLLNRNPATLNDPQSAAILLEVLLENGGTPEQIAALVKHTSVVSVDKPGEVAWLLHALQRAGARAQAAALANRSAVSVSLDDPSSVAELVDTMHKTGANKQLSTLLKRNPAAHVTLTNSYRASRLLERLQEVGAHEQASILTDRLPGEGAFDVWLAEGHQERFRFGREADGSPAEPWDWEDLD
jgi:hypothetical protein